ncbi:conserved repeat protein [Thioploca ingrica]|uniref:Conserved repeat protein n=1 Tax=Thioploca ingrica TaxID=40754 RepID=A0A090AH24_9GAMM|nr:conserved repeat protein [Thioploca ingrica]
MTLFTSRIEVHWIIRYILWLFLLFGNWLSVAWSEVPTSVNLTLIDTKINGIDNVTGLNQVNSVAISSDGRHLYATSFDGAITVFSRDNGSGKLSWVQTVNNSDLDNNGLNGASAVLVSPDSKHVYVASALDKAVVVFTRDQTTGKLTLVEIQQDGSSGGDGLEGANALAMSADNLRLYVTAVNDNALTVFARNVNSGGLTFLSKQQQGLTTPTHVTVSQDNVFIYVTNSNSVSRFTRNPTQGEIAYVDTLSSSGVDGVADLNGAQSMTISPDNNQAYIVSSDNSALLAFSRDASGKLTFLQTYRNNDNGIKGLGGAHSVVVSPDGRLVYVAGMNNSAIAVFNRDTNTGLLSFNNLVQNSSSLDGVTAVTTSPDGNHIYTAATFSKAISAFTTKSTDLEITLTSSEKVPINSPLTYNITVNNKGGEPATGITLIDTLPTGVTFAPIQSTQGCSYDANTNQVTCSLGELQPNTTASALVTVITPATVTTSTLTNKVAVTANQADSNSANNTAEKSTQLSETVSKADLKAEISTNLETASINSPLIYTVTVTNQGPDLANKVVLTSTLPTGVIYDATKSASFCTNTAGTVSCQLGTMEVNKPVQVAIHVTTPGTPGTLNFTTRVNSDDFDPTSTNNTASKTINVANLQFDLVIVDAVANPSTNINVGSDLTYTVTVANNGPTQASEVTLTTTLPSQVSYISSTPACTQVQGQVTCVLGNLNANANQKVVITARAVQISTNISNTFSVSASGQDTNGSNNSKAVTLGSIVGQIADFVVTVDDGGKTVLVGGSVTYAITITNNGNTDDSVVLNVGLTGKNVTIGTIEGKSCGTGPSFSCQIGVIAAGKSEKVTVQATPNELGNITLTAKAEGKAFDPNPSNNTVTKETAVSDKQIDLGVTIAAVPNPAFLAKNLIYTITVTNIDTNNQATGVTVTQELPPGVTFVAAKATQGQCTQTNNLVTCPLGPLDPNGNAKIDTEVTPQSTGKLKSTVTVNSAVFDPQPANDTASIEVEVSQFKADLSLIITDTPDPAAINDPLTYTFTVTNNGPDPVTNIELVSTLPQGITIKTPAQLTPAAVGGNCLDMDVAREIHCTIPTLPNQGTATMTLVVTPTVLGELTNSAYVKGKEFDDNEENNKVTAVTQINNPTTLFLVETQKNGVAGIQGLEGINALTVSLDGQYVYAAGFTDNALVVFKREESDGRLKFFQVIHNDANGVTGLTNASSVSVSPDNAFVYVTGFKDTAVAVFSRDAVSGVLNFVEVQKNGAAGVQGLGGAFAILATTKQVYVAGSSDDAIAIFNRDSKTGQLSFQEAINFADASQSLDGVNALAVSPDGLYLFAASLNSNRLSVFRRDSESGALSLIQTLTNNVAGVQGLEQASGVIVSPDGKQVYTVGKGNDNAITVFQQDPQTGVLGFVEVHRNGIEGVTGLNGVEDLAISPRGDYVYVVSSTDNAVAVFRRDLTTGRLTFVDRRIDGIDGVDGLASARAVAVSPSGAHIYVAGFGDNAIAVLSVATADLNLVMSDGEDPVNVGDNVAYTLTLTNNGPHQATGILLTEQLPENINLMSSSPSQGQCLTAEKQLQCTLGSLKAGSNLTLSLVVATSEPGELSQTMTVIANEFDPTPVNVTETTQVTAKADLWVNIDATPTIARIQTPVTYTITITNDGPHPAKDITLQNEIPNGVQFNSAQLSPESTPCDFDVDKRTVNCAIAELATGANRIVTLIVTPTQEGATLESIATVNASTFDPNLLNNTAKQAMEVLVNIIEETYDNDGKKLENYIIGPTGAVIGGSIAGTIDNQGLISNAWILPNTLISGGKLSKTITNEGIIENVQLLSGTTINGGILRGTITGFPTDLAMINARIAAGTQLSYVIIGSNSQVDPQVKLGEGVTFKSSANIPEGIDLTSLFPFIIEPITQSKAVNLAMDVVAGEGLTLLAAINAIPELRENDLTFSQSLTTGYLSLSLADGEQMILIPLRISQLAATTPPQMTEHSDGSVTFVVQGGRLILAYPAPQSPTDLQTVLENLGLNQVQAEADGNLTIFAQNQFQTRPDLHTQQISPLLPLGLEATPSPLVQGSSLFVLRFVDTENKHRQQFFYPTPAHQEELYLALQGFPGASAVEFYNTGKVSVKIGARTYSGVFDYPVKTGNANTVTQLLPVPDKNGDGSEDIRVLYANGDQQLVYLLPFPEIAEEIQAIPAVQSTGYVVSQDIQGNLLLIQGNNRLLMTTTNLKQLDKATPAQMTINSDGSAEFITNSGLQALTQPIVQEMTSLKNAVRGLGITTIVTESNGNLSLPVTTTRSFNARPALRSTPTWLAMPLGLNTVPTSLPGVLTTMLVFRDETGTKRQQLIYPAAKYPDNLYQFFARQPSVETVTFDNDGTVLVRGGSFNLHGIFDYVVTNTGTPTGGIQFSSTTDINGDGITDFAVIYANGERQVIYQIPQ